MTEVDAQSGLIEALQARLDALYTDADAPAIRAFLAASEAPEAARAYADAIKWDGEGGSALFAPDGAGALVALAPEGGGSAAEQAGALAEAAPAGASIGLGPLSHEAEVDAALGWALESYRFSRYKTSKQDRARLAVSTAARDAARPAALGVFLARDLVNTPTNDLGPDALQAAFEAVAAAFGAEARAIAGDALLSENLPMIHAVGRAGAEAPRLLDMRWTVPGADASATVTLVGKGVCFDTGGLNLKPSRAMRLMKKDMGGAAAALCVATILMASNAPIRLRVLIPAVENAVSSNSFRPGDVLASRKGLTVEIGDTDAEGRLVLADALTLADEEAPRLMVDFATLTGAARVALGPDIAPFYTSDDALAAELEAAGRAAEDPLWRMPLHAPYRKDLSSPIADICNISSTGFAGSITAALFLENFVEKSASWAHFDIFGWNPKRRRGRPEGGEATGARAAARAILARVAAS